MDVVTQSDWARPTFGVRLRAAVEEGVLIGVKWMIVAVLSLWAVSWVLNDYAAVREQARYVAGVRQAQAQAQAQTPARQPAPAPDK